MHFIGEGTMLREPDENTSEFRLASQGMRRLCYKLWSPIALGIVSIASSSIHFIPTPGGRDAVELTQHPYSAGRASPLQAEELIRAVMRISYDFPALMFNEHGECMLAPRVCGIIICSDDSWLPGNLGYILHNPRRWLLQRRLHTER